MPLKTMPSNTTLSQVGSHLLLELYDCPAKLIDNQVYVNKALRDAVEHSGSTLLEDVSHKFHPQGVTAIALLAESHMSIHTWPELGYVAADVFTCGQQASPEKACEFFVEAFQAKRHSLQKIARGPSGECCPGESRTGEARDGEARDGEARETVADLSQN